MDEPGENDRGPADPEEGFLGAFRCDVGGVADFTPDASGLDSYADPIDEGGGEDGDLSCGEVIKGHFRRGADVGSSVGVRGPSVF
ncbi:MAG: hypothetical protein RI897_1384 [Verrucomicrobiota bacterium]